MDFMQMIQVADSAQQVLTILSTYLDSVRGAALLPEALLDAPLDDVRQVEVCMVELMGLVSASSRALDHRRVGAAKHAMHVFAAALWRLKPVIRRARE